MRTYKIHHIDSFSNTLFGGNPTAAVLNADSLADEEMRKIAREMNLSETSFILPSQKADVRFRFFTPPGDEIKFCGHATVGALCAMTREKLVGYQAKQSHLTIETNAGILNVEIDVSQPDIPRFVFDAPKIELVPAPYTMDEVMNAMGIDQTLIDCSKPMMLEKTNNYLYLSALNLECLGKIRLDMQQAIEFAKKDHLVVFCILTNETFDSRNHIHARGFAPLVGIPEDPFTGSMQGGLAAYAIQQRMVDPDTKWIGVEQGHFINRPGFAKLEVAHNPIRVKIHAEACHVFASQISMN